MSRMLSGTRPSSTRKAKVNSAARAPRAMLVDTIASKASRANLRIDDLSGAPSALRCIASARVLANVRNAIEHPAGAVGRGEHCRIAYRIPHQPSERGGEAGDRIPRGAWPRRDAKRQPAVPWKIFELGRADKDRRIEASDGIKTDILDPGRVFAADVFTSHRVTNDDRTEDGGQRRDQLAFQVDSFDRTRVRARLEAVEIGPDANLLVGVVDRWRQQTRGTKPARSHPWRCDPTIGRHRRRSDEVGGTHFIDRDVPCGILGLPTRTDEGLRQTGRGAYPQASRY